jgi:hypothetical protein
MKFSYFRAYLKILFLSAARMAHMSLKSHIEQGYYTNMPIHTKQITSMEEFYIFLTNYLRNYLFESFLDMLFLARVAAFLLRYVEGKLVTKYGTKKINI